MDAPHESGPGSRAGLPRRSRRRLLGTFALAAALAAHGAAIAPPAQPPLRFLGNAALAPIVWQADGAAAGVAVDLARAAAQRAGLEVRIEALDWNAAQREMREGRADALIQINPTPERLETLDFSEVLLESSFNLFRRADRTDIVDAKSLRGRKVGVERAGLPIRFLRDVEGAEVVVIPGWRAGLEQVEGGTLDAVLVDRWVGEYALAQTRIRDVVVVEPPLQRSQSRIAVRKGDAALLGRINEGLRRLEQDGGRGAILARWQAQEVVYVTREVLDGWIFRSVALAALALAAFATWLALQARRMRRLNRALEATDALQRSAIAERDAALQSPVIAAARTRGRRFVWANESFLRLTGYSEEELLGKSARMLYPDDAAWESSPAARAMILAPGDNAREEIEVVRKDGTRLWVDFNVTRFEFAPGEVFATIVDVTGRRQALLALATSEQQLRIASAAGGIGLWSLDRGTGAAWRSERHREIFGDLGQDTPWSLERLLERVVPGDRERVREAILGGREGRPIEWCAQIRRPDGARRWIEARGEVMPAVTGGGSCATGSVVDVTEVRERESQLSFFAQVVQNMNEGVGLVRTGSGEIVYTNEKFDALFGYGAGELVGQDISVLNAAAGGDPRTESRRMMGECERRGTWEGDVHTVKKDGTAFWTRASISRMQHPRYGDVWVCVQGDVDARKRLEQTLSESNVVLERLALRDPLTGLFNRRYLDATAARELQDAARQGHPVAFLMVDVDHFKRINDVHGHQAGDRVLAAIGALLAAATRDSDLACRYGGEEFLLLLPHADAADAARRAEELRGRVAALRIEHGGIAIPVTASLGVALFPEHGGDTMSMVLRADEALYAAKSAGRNCVRAWMPALAARTLRA